MEKEIPIGRSRNIITWLLIAGLLTLRLPFLTGIIMLSKETPLWVDPTFQLGTYFITALLIWWERYHLASYHIDPLVIAIIMLFKPIETIILSIFGLNTPLTFPNPLSFPFIIITICLFISLWKSHYKFVYSLRKSFAWLIIGSISGMLLGLISTIIMIKYFNFPILPQPDIVSLLAPIYQLGFAAIDEEPLFRGFLWGALKKIGCKEYWIWLLQAVLFTVGHFYLLGTSRTIIDLLIIFIIALCMGLLVWQSRTIASSMGFHALWNGSAFFVIAIVRVLFK